MSTEILRREHQWKAANLGCGTVVNSCAPRKRRNVSALATPNSGRISSQPATCNSLNWAHAAKAAVEDELDELIEELIAERDASAGDPDEAGRGEAKATSRAIGL